MTFVMQFPFVGVLKVVITASDTFNTLVGVLKVIITASDTFNTP